ncbi:hypothetical protein PR003_g23078 [Phytophthora rubi]|uniref:Secreted protein n=1 Tax=Phytophthora rubi TaxID=129364 RepID=A0A6A3I2X3_9STRA|nr:hypothetical protein PR002_g25890 [Phytophthora rubi]KAE8975762.1 hypothetical protein PR001_g25611 [Phytophthora rubi]KAE9299127.1 hypothetical protein PR003_g23078 [Phytophthora rubi]
MWYILATCSLATFWPHAVLIAWGQKNTEQKISADPATRCSSPCACAAARGAVGAAPRIHKRYRTLSPVRRHKRRRC